MTVANIVTACSEVQLAPIPERAVCGLTTRTKPASDDMIFYGSISSPIEREEHDEIG
jgi:hypothetical protein